MTDFAAARRSMVDSQVRTADVTRYAIIEAMLQVPREAFVPRAHREIAYAEVEIPLNETRTLMMARVFSKMIEEAEIGPDDLVLDLACGTGYSTAVIARLAEAVVALDADEGLAKTAQQMLDTLEVVNATVSVGDIAAGDAAHAPYDVIVVNGGIETLPDGLLDQLKDGGRLVGIFIGNGVGRCRVITRSGSAFSDRAVFDAYAPVLPGFEKEEQFAF